jgi:hypothetical protein
MVTYIWDTPQSVGLLWTSDQLVAETSTWQHTTNTTDIHAPCGIRTHNPSKRAAEDPRLRPRGHWDRQISYLGWLNLIISFWVYIKHTCDKCKEKKKKAKCVWSVTGNNLNRLSGCLDPVVCCFFSTLINFLNLEIEHDHFHFPTCCSLTIISTR